MRRASRGVVVNVSTLAGRIPLPLFGMYSATKLALAAMSDALALELGASGIRVVHIEAGVVRTDFARSTVISGSAGAADSVYAPTRDRVLGNLFHQFPGRGAEPWNVLTGGTQSHPGRAPEASRRCGRRGRV